MRGYSVGFHRTSSGGRYIQKRNRRHHVDLFRWSRFVAIAMAIGLVAYVAYELFLNGRIAEMAFPLG